MGYVVARLCKHHYYTHPKSQKLHSDVQHKQYRLWIMWLLVNINHQARVFYAHPITQQQHPISVSIECGGWCLSTARRNAIVNRSLIQALVGEAMQLSTERDQFTALQAASSHKLCLGCQESRNGTIQGPSELNPRPPAYQQTLSLLSREDPWAQEWKTSCASNLSRTSLIPTSSPSRLRHAELSNSPSQTSVSPGILLRRTQLWSPRLQNVTNQSIVYCVDTATSDQPTSQFQTQSHGCGPSSSGKRQTPALGGPCSPS